MRISLIIATKNRARSLSACLQRVSAINYDGEWELLVVDNGSADETAKVVDRFAQEFAGSVKYVYEKRPGVSRARNVGVQNSVGRLLAFTDDDCYVATDFLSAIEAEFQNPRLGFLSGRVLQFNPAHGRVAINESERERMIRPFSYVAAGDVVGANMAFRREAFEKVGGFDTDFGGGAIIPSAEECEVGMRLSLAGWEGKFAPKVVVHHDHGRVGLAIKKTIISYDIGRGAYQAKIAFVMREHALALIGWVKMLRRGLRRPLSLRWEIYGAYMYMKHQKRSAGGP